MRKGQSSDGALGPEWIFLLCVCTGQSYRLPSRTVPVAERPTLGGRFSLGAAFTLDWRDASLPWLLKHACRALPAPGPEWLLGLPMRSWRAERCWSLCCEMHAWHHGFFPKCCDACWVLPVDPRASEDPHKCHRNYVFGDTGNSLWSVGESGASDIWSQLPNPSHSAKDTEHECWGPELRSSGSFRKRFAVRAISLALTS